MYAVIMAGGGGTRLHPLSRPERPKPFLPLLGRESLLQLTAARLPTADITVVTDRRYERFVREQLPSAAVVLEPMGRNTAAAIALATLAIDRPEDEVMLVVPADAHIDPERSDTYRDVLASAGEHLATGAFDVEDPLVTLGVQIDRPATEYGYLLPRVDRGESIGGVQAYPLAGFEEKPRPSRAEELREMGGVAWNAGIFLWRRRAIRAALERYTGLIQSLAPMIAAPQQIERAYEAIRQPLSIDHAVMEGAAANGRVVMASMDVGWSDLGSWTSLLAAIGARGEGSVVQAGETIQVADDDLIVRRVGGRLGVIAPLERGSMTAAQPLAVLRGTAPDIEVIRTLIDRCAEPGG
ncbi:MAG TPA: sugar phosphate nucleotidyltransferase [Candidatus Saccharimonadales bacterium]|nr:sugar phosphate nucleotidyltransferase [Candidatus Saccharimonadales bacterium]